MTWRSMCTTPKTRILVFFSIQFSGKLIQLSFGASNKKSSSMFHRSVNVRRSLNIFCHRLSFGVKQTWMNSHLCRKISRVMILEWQWKKQKWWLSERKFAIRWEKIRTFPTWTLNFTTWKTHWSALSQIRRTILSSSASGTQVVQNLKLSENCFHCGKLKEKLLENSRLVSIFVFTKALKLFRIVFNFSTFNLLSER